MAAFLAPLAAMAAPELATAAEAAGSYLLSKGGMAGLKKIANVGYGLLSKRNKSPSALLGSLVKKGAKVLQDPNEVKHVLEQGGKAMQVATSAGKHLAGVLGKHGIINQNQMAKFTHGLGKVNHGFHHTLGKLGKIHGHLLPFLGK